MLLLRQFQGLSYPLFLAVMFLSGCVSDDKKPQFYTYCDNTGCYQCDRAGCGRVAGQPPGSACKTSKDCAPGCFCQDNGQCAEAGFCDKPGDCGKGYVCNTARHSCEPPGNGNGQPGGGTKPQACKAAADCALGSECQNGACQPAPVLANHCVFSRECGTGGVCQDAACQKGCQDAGACGTGRACTDGRCQPAPGSACVLDTGCGAGKTCIDGVCHPRCAKDAECQAQNKNDICVQGVCRADERRLPECKLNADCSDGRECVNAQCRAFCFAASDCAKCTDGNVCQTGYCMTSREAAPQCQVVAECGGKTHCRDGACSQ